MNASCITIYIQSSIVCLGIASLFAVLSEPDQRLAAWFAYRTGKLNGRREILYAPFQIYFSYEYLFSRYWRHRENQQLLK